MAKYLDVTINEYGSISSPVGTLYETKVFKLSQEMSIEEIVDLFKKNVFTDQFEIDLIKKDMYDDRLSVSVLISNGKKITEIFYVEKKRDGILFTSDKFKQLVYRSFEVNTNNFRLLTDFVKGMKEVFIEQRIKKIFGEDTKLRRNRYDYMSGDFIILLPNRKEISIEYKNKKISVIGFVSENDYCIEHCDSVESLEQEIINKQEELACLKRTKEFLENTIGLFEQETTS